MPLVNMKDMLHHAYHHGYAVGAFNLAGLDFLEGIVAAAGRCRAPVILSLAESHGDFFDFDLMMAAVEAAARRASVPVAIHLDHGTTLASAVRAINRGCNGVMVDASYQSLHENIRLTQDVVAMARGCGVPVEGELGYVPDVEGADPERHPGQMAYTTVAEAKGYVVKTGVDFLAVSIGTVHGRMKGKAKLDYQRLKQINEALGIPLAIHGGTGLSDDQFRRLIANGVAKISYYTALGDAAGAHLRKNAKDRNHSSYIRLISEVKEAVGREATRCMRVWGCAGRAAEVLAQCAPWEPVDHLIVYNVTGIDEGGVTAMMNEGRRVLGAIPGVREVVAGKAMREDAKYRYAWLVRFCHPAVIDSYRDHPDHVAFANKLFRPVAADRISIDYRVVSRGLIE